MKTLLLLPIVAVVVLFLPGQTEAWRGHYETYRTLAWRQRSYCTCWYWWWGCSYWRYNRWSYWITQTRCRAGWTHNGDYNCNVPICRPSCQNNGKCVNPNTCDCPDTATGSYCGSLTCSYARPCYPGDCGATNYANKCRCEDGFLYATSGTGCVRFDSTKDKMKPVVGKNNITLSNIRRDTKVTDYMFILEGTSENDDELETVWSNQRRFNHLKFDVEAYFVPLSGLPNRPPYVHDSKIGIVEAAITANVSKIPRRDGPIRDVAFHETYSCPFSRDYPEVDVASCAIEDEQFSTQIEHGDWLHVDVMARSGGYQQLFNTDRGTFGNKNYYTGLQVIKSVRFLFDFVAPKHCTQPGAYAGCPSNAVILEVAEEFTKQSIRPRWLGWTDDLSGVWEYYVEVFKLGPDPYERLTETNPLEPVFNVTIDHSDVSIPYPVFRPEDPGMYSVLVETRDIANNSRISRRFVLFDDTSDVTINDDPDAALYVSSAEPETGYRWQTSSDANGVRIDLKWANHFRNVFHEENKLLNQIESYPIQFKDIEDDGLLSVKKYVADELDDNEGGRTKNAIPNFHGIVKFEVVEVFTQDDNEPTNGWTTIGLPLRESYTLTRKLSNGQSVRLWVRATDAMGNQRADHTVLNFDNTPPIMERSDNPNFEFTKNVKPTNQSSYNYSSKINFKASDTESGVYKFGIKVTVNTSKGDTKVLYDGFTPANVADDKKQICALTVDGKCFNVEQEVQINNCWFLVSREDLEESIGEIELTAYNQAMLTSKTSLSVGKISQLAGLEKYDGPTNFRTESSNPNGFRLTWDLPKKPSCYGRATIVITMVLGKNDDGSLITRTFYVDGNSRYYDILGLNPNTEYKLEFGLQTSNTSAMVGEGVTLAVRTEEKNEGGTPGGLIAGVAVGVLAIVAIAIIVFAIMVRRGVLAPPREQARRFTNTVRRKTQTLYGGLSGTATPRKKSDYAYDNRQSELYIYGGMDMSGEHEWDIDRNDVTFESLLKVGHFANIYKAQLKKQYGAPTAVVAKTLKENYSSDDELLMKAKINFSGKEIGSHPNVLQFIGAVLSDPAMGPFIIYEYCENGTLKEYLTKNKSNVSIEVSENLFRFGLDIAKGMEYLSLKKIVHRRLAARNILLTFVNEVKISGFGPQPQNDDEGDAETGKKERIPIKWMAPECMESTKEATVKSDVWSYAVVLWEIFSMGETPYTGHSRDLPQRIKRGERLGRPEHCDDVWYGVMKKCWEYKPAKRPTFTEIRDELDHLFVASTGDDYYYYKR